jgi:hypothetical protein
MKLEDLKPGVTVYKANTSRGIIFKETISYINTYEGHDYRISFAMNEKGGIAFALSDYNVEGFKNGVTTHELFFTVEEAAMWILSNKASYESYLGRPFPKDITYQSLVQSCK